MSHTLFSYNSTLSPVGPPVLDLERLPWWHCRPLKRSQQVSLGSLAPYGMRCHRRGRCECRHRHPGMRIATCSTRCKCVAEGSHSYQLWECYPVSLGDLGSGWGSATCRRKQDVLNCASSFGIWIVKSPSLAAQRGPAHIPQNCGPVLGNNGRGGEGYSPGWRQW